MKDSTSAAWITFDRVNVNNEFTFAAFYNFASEGFSCFHCQFANAHSASGPITTLGAITGGSSYTNGTYNGVALTGGSGGGALANITVSGNAVTAVTLVYQGKGYTTSDTLSAAAASIGGTGSGFSIPVSAVGPYVVVIDGQNYWRASSAYVSITNAVNTWQSLGTNRFFGGSIRQLASVQSALWLGNAIDVNFYDTYVLGTGSYCVSLFDNGVQLNANFPIGNSGLAFKKMICEGASVGTFYLYGANATPLLTGVSFHGSGVGSYYFNTASNITGVTWTNADVSIPVVYVPTQTMFAAPKLWTVSGNVRIQAAKNWNAPASFQGTLVYGTQATPPGMGPLDIMGSAAGAWSCARRLGQSYTGALCNFVRASDSATLDVYPDGFGNLDRQAYTSFCNGTTCKIVTAYDQSGNGNNATQTTDANRPTLTLADSSLGNRPAITFTDGGALALSVTSSASINNLNDSGGYTSSALRIAAQGFANRIFYKTNTSSYGWEFRFTGAGTSLYYMQGALTSAGNWTSSALGTGGFILDTTYNASNNANVPVIYSQGTSLSLTPTQPVGSETSSDNASNLIIGNQLVTGGSRGFNGGIGEAVMWKAVPTAQQLSAIRRNQAAYYGLGATVN